MARRIRAVRNFLIGASFAGAATFTTLAAYHSHQTNSSVAAAATEGAPIDSALQLADNVSTTQAPSSSFFSVSQTSGYSVESGDDEHEHEHDSDEHDHEHEHEHDQDDDDGGSVAQLSSSSQQSTMPQPSTSSSTRQTQPTTPQVSAPTSSGHHTRTATS